ncbi:hypothetical protein [Sphingorhabdus sp.]|uniref:hypothetical protein n=1 Tax=Sphingorhabdus sp. TaxID=1902408 RepID=UPI0039836242
MTKKSRRPSYRQAAVQTIGAIDEDAYSLSGRVTGNWHQIENSAGKTKTSVWKFSKHRFNIIMQIDAFD